MKIVQKTQPTSSYPISIDDVKSHLRFTSEDEDQLISGVYIPASTSFVENYTNRTLLQRSLYMYLDRFPIKSEIEIPRGYCSSITEIKYIAPNQSGNSFDDATVFSSTKYGFVATDFPKIFLLPDQYWDNTKDILNAVRIEFVSGQTVDKIDPLLKLGIIKMACHMFENRNIVAFGASGSELPYGIKEFIDPFVIDWL